MKSYFIVPIALGIFFFSCKSAKKTTGKYKEMDTVSISAHNNPMAIYRASAPRVWDLVHTRAVLSFDYENKTAIGEATLTLHPYFYATDTLWLDAKSMKIETVKANNNTLSYAYDHDMLKIKLPKQYNRQDTLKLSIRYTAMPYAAATGGSSAITDDRGLYFINTDNSTPGKPIQIWTQGETESNSHWLPTIDKPNERTTVELVLTVPNKYKTLSNGALIASTDNGVMRTDVWSMDKPIQVYAIMFAIGDFSIIKDKWNEKEVSYYVEPEYAPYAGNMFKYTPDMIEFFSNVTGVPYPWNKYSQVVVRDYVSGAMENTSASLFGEFVNQNNRELADKNFEDVVSHELFHQWFGDYVTAESWSNLTVNESFATYGEYLWRRFHQSKVKADELAYDDLARYLTSTEYKDPVLVRFHYRDREDMFDRVSYQKGGAILHYLNALMGDSAFYRSMNIYLSTNALHAAEAHNWRMAVEAATGQDWNWFFNQWYYRAGHPKLNIQYDYSDDAKQLAVTVSQVQDTLVGLYHLPCMALVLNGDDQQIVDWDITQQSQTFYYPYKNGVAPIIVPDIEHVLPATITENKTYRQWLEQLKRTHDYVSKLNAVNAVAAKDINNIDVEVLLRTAMADKIAAIRLAALRKVSKIDNDATRKKWNGDIILLAMNDADNNVRATSLYTLGTWGDATQKQLMLESVNDSSYMVAGNALYALNRIAKDTAYVVARKMLDGKPGTILDANAWLVIANKGQAQDTALFRHYIAKNVGGNRNYLCTYLTSYCSHTDNTAAYAAGLDMLSHMIEKIENKNSRLNYAGLLTGLHEELKAGMDKDKKAGDIQQELAQLRATVQELKSKEQEKDILKVYNDILSE